MVSYLWRHIGSTDIEAPQVAGTFEAFRSIDSVNYFDLTGTWQITDEIGVNLAIYNIFDEQPPVVGNEAGTTAANSGNTFPSMYDTLGTCTRLASTCSSKVKVERNEAADLGPPPSLVEQAIGLAQKGEFHTAEARLYELLEAEPKDLLGWVTLAGIRGHGGDAAGQFEAIQKALAIDPYYVPGLLLKGNWFESQGNAVLAASSYTHALTVSARRSVLAGAVQGRAGPREAVCRTSCAWHEADT